MAENYKQVGDRLATANATGSDVSAGAPLLAGTQWRIALVDIANGASGECATAGVWNLAATSADAWADGDRLYWDPATSKLTDVAGALTQIGFAVGLKAALTLTADVLLSAL